MAKKRLDVLMTERGLTPSREKAQAAIMAGVVTVNGVRELKAGTGFSEDAQIEITEDVLKYVSRGGLKLEKAVTVWDLDLDGRVCMDIGASTGGFTDLMLKAGAVQVYCVDVGYGQLDWKLRNDPRIVNMERTNIRYMDPLSIDPKPSFISIDVSFISLKLVLPVAARILTENGRIVALIKPQFEAERAQVGKKGVIRDEKVHRQVIDKVKGYAADCGLEMTDVIKSPITGAKGNVEFLGLMAPGRGV
ncbi:MAG: TlyA family RNA methyltransferase [Clostridiales Family XIII bacterium]|jgi:23S rRNA (cytidine1920-2'-O)/16S rRNA (cytidine1409-2'-O)-methyltransferase|nr:TlyA family RNA methyltransferase [Clostridiales Family XIII bacterium]